MKATSNERSRHFTTLATSNTWSCQLGKILSKRQFAERIGRSVRHLERLISEGEGPPIVRLGVRAVGIDEDDGDAWLASRRVVPPGFKGDVAR
jgi:predicted DNA-binding transcriptional regulator AlpA